MIKMQLLWYFRYCYQYGP